MSARAPFAVEFRTKSSRTKTGWTKWRHYIVSPSREQAERTIAGLADWCRVEEGELRIVERKA